MITDIVPATQRHRMAAQAHRVLNDATVPRCFGPFEVLHVLGEGATATVYKARHIDTQAIVALKVLHPDFDNDRVRLKRFELEFLTCSRMSHANLNLTRLGQILGSPHFMAPEQFTNARQVGRSSDTYGLAATLYYVATGHRPFAARGALSILEKKLKNDLVEPRALNSNLSAIF